MMDHLRSISRDLKLLWLAVFFLMLGFGIYSASFFNFVTDFIGIRPEQLGILEAVRELPGFLCVFVTALAMRVAEPVLGAMALSLVAVGMGAYATVNGVPSLVVWSFIWSLGLHTWMPLCSSTVLGLSNENNKGKRLGQTSAIGSLGMISGMACVMIVGHGLPYHKWFLLGSMLIVVAVFALLQMRRDIGHANKPRFVLREKYLLYYALAFLEGCRKQVFFTFAPFALTKVYGASLRTMATLMVINNVINLIFSPVIGKAIDSIGERKILLVSYTAMVFVFLGYAGLPWALALYVLYCLDNFFYLSTTCLTTYIHRIAEPEDLMPTLSLGVTMNHAAAVTVPLIGGYLWSRFSYPVTFYGGARVVIISLLLAGKVGKKKTECV